MQSATLTEANASRQEVVTLARFPVVCRLCGGEVQRGQAIKLYGHYPNSKRKMWVHYDCGNPDAQVEVKRRRRSDDAAPPADPKPAPAADPVPPAVAKAAGELAADVAAFLEVKLAEVNERVDSLDASVKQLGDENIALLDAIEKIETAAPRVIEIKRPDGERFEIDGCTHPAFEEVLELASAREEVFLPGPAGCGKSHLARQIAEALDLHFGFISCSAGMSEAQLLGRMIPAGENGQFVFIGTAFLECYENGGVFLFDEIDAADPNVMLVINAALANGHLAVPARHDNPVAKRHPDFVFIAAANTYGKGADRMYTGRNEMDESTLDRLRMGTVEMDYDEALERQLCPDEELLARLHGYRQRVREARLERIVSTRFVAKAYQWRQRGWSLEKIDSKLFGGWRADEAAKVKR